MADAYVGREQTEAKHFILRKYLQTLAFKILEGGYPTLTYVDGFSGPWKSKTDDFSDTSFMIAIAVLRDAHKKFREKGTPKEVRCFFVEEDLIAYARLNAAVRAHHDPANGFYVETFQGRFEDAVPKIVKFVGKSFALTFIDPTGWTGFPYSKITPLLLHQPGEVLINFMYDYINRFVASDDPAIVETFDSILGGPNWKTRLDPNLPPGEAAEKLFRHELRKAGAYRFVLSTTIEKATADRPHFSIAYGTHSSKGLRAFRQVEYDALRGHTKRRVEAKLQKENKRRGQDSLFVADDLPEINSIEQVVAANKLHARSWIENIVRNQPTTFTAICDSVLERFMLRETDVKNICVDLANDGTIKSPWKNETPKLHKPHGHHLIELTKPPS
jgi:three-Cys-motif partner protein